MQDLIRRTAWIVPSERGFDAINSEGKILASNKFKSTLHLSLRQMAAASLVPGMDCWAIAEVVKPSDRQPNRKLPRRRSR